VTESNRTIEERLQRAMEHRAETTTVDPDAWEQLQARLPRRRGFRVPITPKTLVPALAVAVALVIIAVSVFRSRGDDQSVRLIGGPPPRFVLGDTPTGYRPVLLLDLGPVPDNLRASTLRVYGQRGDGGLLASDAIVVLTSRQPVNGATSGQTTANDDRLIAVRGKEAVLHHEEPGPTGPVTVTWIEREGLAVEATLYPHERTGRSGGDKEEQLLDVVRSLRFGAADPPDDASVTVGALPDGFEQVYEGPPAIGNAEGLASTRLQYAPAAGEQGGVPDLSLDVTRSGANSLDAVAWRIPNARAVRVRGKPALLGSFGSDGSGVVTWVERDGVIVSVSGEVSGEQLIAAANGMREVSESEWQRIVGPLPRSLGDRFGSPESSSDVSKTVVARGTGDGYTWEARADALDGGQEVCFGVHVTTSLWRRVGRECSSAGGAEADFGPIGQPHEVFGVAVTDFGRATFVSGQAGSDVAVVRVELAGGERVDVQPAGEQANLLMRFFVTKLASGDRPVDVIALGPGGRELSRRALPPVVDAEIDTED
jgi:hypothetical protein